MTLDLSGSGIRFKDLDGFEPFSTDVEMLHVLDERSGSLAIAAAQSNYRAHLQQSVSHLIADDIDPAATHVIGAARIQWTGVGRPVTVVDDSWWMWNGTFVIFYEFGAIASGGNAGYVYSLNRETLASWTDLTPRVDSGSLYIDERTFIRGNIPGPLYGPIFREAFTLHWKLKTCIFS